MLEFCEECYDMVEYYVEKKGMTKNIKGKEVEYIGKVAYCDECKEEIFVSEIRDYNLMKLDKAFREVEDLITVSEMELILEKYDIGKRPLSLLLGWGELTLTRYLDGDIPTRQYSDILKKVLDNPDDMEELLEKNKNKISDLAYRKSMETLKNIGANSVFNINSIDKIDHVIKYLLVNSSDITPLALQKLLYYCQSFFKIFTGEFLFSNDCEAWVHGPVYNNVYHRYKNYGYASIFTENDDQTDINLTTLEKEVLDNVLRNFGCYSGKILEEMTHVELPWVKTRLGLDDKENSNRIIEKDLIVKYFSDVKVKYNMLNISDIKDYSIDLFEKISN